MKISKLLLSIGLLSWLNATCAPALADTPLRSLLRERLAARQNASSNDGYGRFINHLSCEKLARLSQGKNRNGQSSSTPSQTASYGSHPAQKLEFYLPEHTKTAAPIIIMVHGGAWCVGDMDAANVVNNKLARWLPKGFIFVSANYRMLPDQADVLTQAGDVAKAIAYVQKHAADWHGDPSQIIVMGHSAGAHLVSLLSADPAMARTYGAQPWLGSVSLDSAALDVPATMQAQHPLFYDDAFGQDPAFWQKTSPLQRLGQAPLPWLGVCSTQRKDSCPQAHAYSAALQRHGRHSEVLEVNLKHGEVNSQLGEPGPYTEQVERFMASLGKDIRQHLALQP